MDILIFIIALSVLVLVHELGHFIAAKKTGVRVEEFGLGLPPKIIGKRIKGTLFSLNALPIGGFCRLYGEDPTSSEAKNEVKNTYMSKNPWQKLLIVLGGVLMNLVLAIIVFSVVYTVLGVPEETDKVKIIGVVENSPAQIAGLRENDWIYKIAADEIKTPQELTEKVSGYKGKDVELTVVGEDNNQRVVNVNVRENPPAGEGSMGVAISNTEMVKVPWYQFYKGIGAGFKEALFWGKVIGGGVFNMVSGLFKGEVPKDISGPVGMYEATSSIKRDQGMLALIHFFGVISVNLAVVNILPFPALDGGRILFVLYEMIFRRRVNEKVEMMVNNLGMLILLSLIILITIGDVRRIFTR